MKSPLKATGLRCSRPSNTLRNCLLASCLFLVPLCLAQAPPLVSNDVAAAMQAIKDGNYYPVDVENLVRAKAVQAVPQLRQQFEKETEPLLKGKIASALLRLGDKNDVYWNYLLSQATPALQDDAPWPYKFDANGKMLNEPSPAFLQWNRAHNTDPAQQLDKMMGEDRTAIYFLAESQDPRAIPYLRQALLSPNYYVQGIAADWLSRLSDRTSISLMIDACRRAPADFVVLVAKPLLRFHDARARSTATKYLTKDQMKLAEEEHAYE